MEELRCTLSVQRSALSTYKYIPLLMLQSHSNGNFQCIGHINFLDKVVFLCLVSWSSGTKHNFCEERERIIFLWQVITELVTFLYVSFASLSQGLAYFLQQSWSAYSSTTDHILHNEWEEVAQKPSSGTAEASLAHGCFWKTSWWGFLVQHSTTSEGTAMLLTHMQTVKIFPHAKWCWICPEQWLRRPRYLARALSWSFFSCQTCY